MAIMAPEVWMTRRQRRQFTAELKAQAVRLVREVGSVSQAAYGRVAQGHATRAELLAAEVPRLRPEDAGAHVAPAEVLASCVPLDAGSVELLPLAGQPRFTALLERAGAGR